MSSVTSMVWAGTPASYEVYVDGNYYKTRVLAGKLRALVWLNGQWVQSNRDPLELRRIKRGQPTPADELIPEYKQRAQALARERVKQQTKETPKPEPKPEQMSRAKILDVPQFTLRRPEPEPLPEPTKEQRGLKEGDMVDTPLGCGVISCIDKRDSGNVFVKLLGKPQGRWIDRAKLTLTKTVGD